MKTNTSYVSTNPCSEDFESMLKKFMVQNPDIKKQGSRGFHRAMNKKHQLRDHPRWAAAGCPQPPKYSYLGLSDPLFIEDFIALIYEGRRG